MSDRGIISWTGRSPSDYAGKEISPRTVSLPHGLVLVCCLALSVSACAARSFDVIGLLMLANGILFFTLRLPPARFRKLPAWFAKQTVLITGLYMLRFGMHEGLLPGVRVSCQLLLAFLPAGMAMQSVPQSQIAGNISRILPHRTAFVLATSLRFIPVLKGEFLKIYRVQRFRGARIAPKELWNIRNWGDVVHCLLVPFIIQAFKMAENAALAARIRNFDISEDRTYWPGDED